MSEAFDYCRNWFERRLRNRISNSGISRMSIEPEASLSSAREFHLKGQLDRAEEIYAKIIKVEPKNAEAWHLIGVLMLQKGQGEISESHIVKAISLNSAEAKYYNNLSSAQKLCGKNIEAEASLREAIRINPNFADAHINLGIILLEQNRIDETRWLLESAAERLPENVEICSLLSNLYADLDQYDLTINTLRASLA